MASIKLTGDTSGEITISAPAVAGTNTLTLPASTGTVITSNSPASDLPSTIAGPSFSAYASAGVTLTANVSTKMALNVEEWDTNSNYDTTNYRFTPTVAGYYQFNGTIQYTSNPDGYLILYKNGSAAKYGYLAAARSSYIATISTMLYCNGTTDYVELYAVATINSGAVTGSALTTFNGFLARAE